MPQVREGGLATAEGLSYLEVKHLLLLHYCLHLLFYLLLRAEGRPVADHPVIARLVEIRAFMDRLRPLDKRMQYQVDKLLAAAQTVQVRSGRTHIVIVPHSQGVRTDLDLVGALIFRAGMPCLCRSGC